MVSRIFFTLQGVWNGRSLHPLIIVDDLISKTICPLSSNENTISGSPLLQHDLALISDTAFYEYKIVSTPLK